MNTLKQPYTNAQYAEFAACANRLGKIIEKEENGDATMADASAPTLEEAKNAKTAENERARQVKFISISLGKLKTQTPLGDLKTALPLYEKIAYARGGLPEGAVRLYDEDGTARPSPNMTLEELEAATLEIAAAYMEIDIKSTEYTQAILSAQTLEELEGIEFEY
ncbi:hypothetical protein tpqmel_1054 [Candidatus Gastranaerophilus sp. (ex Termes propinquus)]|nr:hypothetical protein tpqmel_1054 [Candidatus Gastranaerophilus sp. (ex Termes propinquus)]